MFELLCLLCLLFPYVSNSNEASHSYTKREDVLVWANKVGPFANPSETYPYYASHVPFCTRASILKQSHDDFHYSKFDGLGSLLEGNNLVHSGIPLKFNVNESNSIDCTMILNKRKSDRLIQAISEKYWYQMYIDDLPVWGMVGEYLPESKQTSHHHHDNLDNVLHENFAYDPETNSKIEIFPHIFTHKAFSISYNGNQIIEVNLTSEDPILIKKQKKGEQAQNIKMTFSIKWIKTSKPFNKRFDRYLDFEFFEHQIHWFAIVNSFMLVIFLVGMVSMVLLRALKKDYERIALEENDDDLHYSEVVDETGWKKLHGDVFRAPENLPVFSAFIGTGCQLYCSCLLVIILAISGRLYDTRGTISTVGVLTYALTAFAAGYLSSQVHLEYSNENSNNNNNNSNSNINNNNNNWKITMILTGLLFPSIVFLICFILNILSIFYKATNAISFLTFITMLFIWILSLVLLFVGTLVGRTTYKKKPFPCDVNINFKRPLPDNRPWYMNLFIFCISVGILPFGSIFIEMYYIFNSFWNYKFYYVYGFMLLVFLILTIVTICVTIVAVYLLLNNEDRRWKWVSIFSSGSTALYVFLYATFYFHTKTKMTGLFQTSFYFGYMFLFSLAIFFVCGTVGYIGSSHFVRVIYDGIKVE